MDAAIKHHRKYKHSVTWQACIGQATVETSSDEVANSLEVIHLSQNTCPQGSIRGSARSSLDFLLPERLTTPC